MTGATWTLIGVIVGIIGSGIVNYILQRQQFKHNIEMFHLQNKSKEQVMEILSDMLNHRVYTDRTFKALKSKVGGFSDDEIRQMLHEIGATKSLRNDDDEEWWYLRERENERIEKRKLKEK
jgi:hypothetical protein